MTPTVVVADTLRTHTATPSELMTDLCDWLSQLWLISQRCVDAVRVQEHVHTAGIVCVRGIMKDYSHTHTHAASLQLCKCEKHVQPFACEFRKASEKTCHRKLLILQTESNQTTCVSVCCHADDGQPSPFHQSHFIADKHPGGF